VVMELTNSSRDMLTHVRLHSPATNQQKSVELLMPSQKQTFSPPQSIRLAPGDKLEVSADGYHSKTVVVTVDH